MNAQLLLDCIKANEESTDEFDMSGWHSCGTLFCLVGNHINSGGLPGFELAGRAGIRIRRMHWAECGYSELACGYSELAQAYGITGRESRWLFSSLPLTHYGCSRSFSEKDVKDKEAAINRIRKFVYWKLRKKEMLYDEKGCILEEAKHTEGDWNVCEHVLEKVS